MLRIVILLVVLILALYALDRMIDHKTRKTILRAVAATIGASLLLILAFVIWEHLGQSRLEQAVTVRYESYTSTPNSAEIAFEICNKRDHDLQQVQFFVSGYVSGRSTPHAILRQEKRSRDKTELHSDLIITPDQCQIDRWQGAYISFDRYEISQMTVIWSDGKKVVIRP
ncbi:MAG: hypothetical protein ACOH5I_06970 [Oligoflexus sp.]